MYYILKNAAIWLVQSILGNQKKNFARRGVCDRKSRIKIIFI